jgi:hypothetical protein
MSTAGVILGAVADIGLVGVIMWLIILHRKLVILVGNGGTMWDKNTEEKRFDPPEEPSHPRETPEEYRDGIDKKMDAES